MAEADNWVASIWSIQSLIQPVWSVISSSWTSVYFLFRWQICFDQDWSYCRAFGLPCRRMGHEERRAPGIQRQGHCYQAEQGDKTERLQGLVCMVQRLQGMNFPVRINNPNELLNNILYEFAARFWPCDIWTRHVRIIPSQDCRVEQRWINVVEDDNDDDDKPFSISSHLSF